MKIIKRKTKSIIFTAIIVIMILSLSIIPVFAIQINGENYTQIIDYEFYEYEFKIYGLNFNTNEMLNSTFNLYNIQDLILNSLYIEITTETFENEIFKNISRKFFNGYYVIKELDDAGIPGPFPSSGSIYAFNTILSQFMIYSTSQYIIPNSLSPRVNPDVLKYSIVFECNENFAKLYRLNLYGFLNDLMTYSFIPIKDYDIEINNSVFSIFFNSTLDNNFSTLYAGIRYNHTNTRIEAPISIEYNYKDAMRFLKNENTWAFLPSQIIAIIVPFVSMIIGTAFVVGAFKKIGG